MKRSMRKAIVVHVAVLGGWQAMAWSLYALALPNIAGAQIITALAAALAGLLCISVTSVADDFEKRERRKKVEPPAARPARRQE